MHEARDFRNILFNEAFKSFVLNLAADERHTGAVKYSKRSDVDAKLLKQM